MSGIDSTDLVVRHRPAVDLTQVAERLWPAPARVEQCARREPATSVVRELAFVPNAREPRMLVPADLPRAASGAVRRFSAGLSRAEHLTRLVAGLALRLPGSGRLLADRLRITATGHPESIETHLSDLLGMPVLVGIGVGALRANQKPVLQVFDRAGRTVAFVKVGDGPVSRQLVEREAVALREVNGRCWQRLRTPTVVHNGWWRDLRLLVISPVPATSRPRLRRAGGPPTAAMAELAAGFDSGTRKIADCPLLSRLRTTADLLADGENARRLGSAVDAIEARAGDVSLRLGGWHGDWTPWNMSARGQQVGLWDWERFDTGVPVGFDLVHFLVQSAARRHGIAEAVVDHAVSQAGQRIGPYGELIGTLYTATVAARYLHASEPATGAPLRAQAQLMLRMLGARVDRVPEGQVR
ncbi:phosphotransferase [Fodinicola acaciae]|uniref:phosphotransferase n=1 Tax=Fodinicola acaciae TaxID=2681555 RepID=UPI0013D0236B|nr:phosphotransferase [Fodinicola acaciae]